ncbi:homeobox-domain-containing protein [Hymenopellis radicata]|nr:homeobox-domain-containing protein [Hymenopellis radicata]
MPPVASTDRPKKPRNRHSPHQLAALNELYERDEHPALEVRTSLADRLGMETKTVNSWFQNKRASTKKRTVSSKSVAHHAARINSSRPSHSSSTSSTPRPSESGDYPDDDYPDSHQHHLPDDSHSWPSYQTADPEHNLLSETESMARRLRLRPSAEQKEALRKAYVENPNPSSDQRQALADSVGMRYQGVSEWFQKQPSTLKNSEEEPELLLTAPVQPDAEPRNIPAFPPPSKHPSLGLPPPTQHPSLALSRPRRSPSVHSSNPDESSPSKRSSRRSNTPYSMSSRMRRARPEPHQLDALKDLFIKNPTPTIEQRTALALEIGMDLGKNEDDDDDYGYSYPHRTDSANVSRSTTPSTEFDDHERMDQDYDEDSHMAGPHSDVGSDDEYQEAVTRPRTITSASQDQSRREIRSSATSTRPH